jgi:hypothetical protein
MTREEDDEDNIVSATFTSAVTAYGVSVALLLLLHGNTSHASPTACVLGLLPQIGQPQYTTGSCGT